MLSSVTGATTQRERVTLEGELRDLPLNNQTQLAEIDRNIAALEQELAEVESKRQIVIPAPQDGTVTAIQAEPGSRADTTVPLLSIVPTGSKLEAQLFSPSRAIGFVRPGQRVLLRYEAFPYQKFGQYEGIVANVSRSAISPGELTQQLAGLTTHRANWVSTTIRRARTSSRMACQADERTGNLSEFPRSKADFQGWFAGAALAPAELALPPDGRGYPFRANEPVYCITVSLTHQAVTVLHHGYETIGCIVHAA